MHLPRRRPGSRASCIVEWRQRAIKLWLASLLQSRRPSASHFMLLKSSLLFCEKECFDSVHTEVFLTVTLSWGVFCFCFWGFGFFVFRNYRKEIGVCVAERLEFHGLNLLVFGSDMNGPQGSFKFYFKSVTFEITSI